jgi:hypothetical protein
MCALLIARVRDAATKWPRCCDQWQDGLGGMHCRECAQKTFAMLYLVQQALGVDKGCGPLRRNPPASPQGEAEPAPSSERSEHHP